jgi:hypothetical protein
MNLVGESWLGWGGDVGCVCAALGVRAESQVLAHAESKEKKVLAAFQTANGRKKARNVRQEKIQVRTQNLRIPSPALCQLR